MLLEVIMLLNICKFFSFNEPKNYNNDEEITTVINLFILQHDLR